MNIIWVGFMSPPTTPEGALVKILATGNAYLHPTNLIWAAATWIPGFPFESFELSCSLESGLLSECLRTFPVEDLFSNFSDPSQRRT